jgi:hypothetical protein
MQPDLRARHVEVEIGRSRQLLLESNLHLNPTIGILHARPRRGERRVQLRDERIQLFRTRRERERPEKQKQSGTDPSKKSHSEAHPYQPKRADPTHYHGQTKIVNYSI